VVAVLEGIISQAGIQPTFVRCDNGSEFTVGVLVNCCNSFGVSTAFIEPGSSWQNGFVESFNAQFRREQLSREIMDTLVEARSLADEWKDISNRERSHGSLD